MVAFAASDRFVLTGPSGWIGQAMLAYLGERMGGALGGRVTAFASSGRDMRLASGETLAFRALTDLRPADLDGAHVLHLAYLTKEKAEQLGERVFTETNLAIDDHVLDAMREATPASVFVASSGAASLAASGADLHPYGLAKLRQEARFQEAGSRSGVPVLAGRIFNIAGPHVNKLSSYAMSNMLMQARDTGRIQIAATVPVFRSFLHVTDLCALACGAGLAGLKMPRSVDLCGAEIVEMADLAAAIDDIIQQNVKIERATVNHDRPSAYLGDFTQTRVLAMELGIALAPLRSQIADTLSWLDAQRTDVRAMKSVGAG